MMRLTRLRAQLELVVTRLQKDKAAFEAYKVRFHCLLSHPWVSSVFRMLSIRTCLSSIVLHTARKASVVTRSIASFGSDSDIAAHHGARARPAGCPARQSEEVAKWEAQRAEDARRLKRDRRELDQQARELLKLPTRKERAEVSPTLPCSSPLSQTQNPHADWLQHGMLQLQVETLEEALRHERRSAAEKEARNKLNVDRLRRQISELQVRGVWMQHSTFRMCPSSGQLPIISCPPQA